MFPSLSVDDVPVAAVWRYCSESRIGHAFPLEKFIASHYRTPFTGSTSSLSFAVLRDATIVCLFPLSVSPAVASPESPQDKATILPPTRQRSTAPSLRSYMVDLTRIGPLGFELTLCNLSLGLLDRIMSPYSGTIVQTRLEVRLLMDHFLNQMHQQVLHVAIWILLDPSTRTFLVGRPPGNTVLGSLRHIYRFFGNHFLKILDVDQWN